MNIKNTKKIGHTAVETLVAISLIAFIGTISIMLFTQNFNSDTKIRIKNCYLEITQVVDKILNNPRYYSSTADFTDTSEVDLFGGQSFSKGVQKFKQIVAYEMGQELGGKIKCEALSFDGSKGVKNDCFQGDNGAIWYIAESDFNVKTYRYNNTNYVPITFYPNPRAVNANDINYFDEEAVIIGVARDGSIGLIQTVNCKTKKYKDYMQCKAESLIAESKALN